MDWMGKLSLVNVEKYKKRRTPRLFIQPSEDFGHIGLQLLEALFIVGQSSFQRQS